MSLCSELENINISIDYFIFIKGVFADYLQYIINYKIIANEYIKKLELFQDKFSPKLSGVDKDNIKNKIMNISHIFSLTSPLIKIIQKQIENLKIFMEGIDLQKENINKLIKEKEILSNKFQIMFEESRKDLLKKYTEKDKLRNIFQINMLNTEDILDKYFNKKDNIIITKEQMSNVLSTTKKIEKEYKDEINSTKLYEETFDSLYLSSLENFEKLSSEASNLLKDFITNFLVLWNDKMKMMLIELDMQIPFLSNLDEIKEIENIIMKSYSKNNKLIHVKPDKYKLRIFQKFKEVKENKEYLNKSPILSIDDGFEEMILISDENTMNILKIMKKNFELFEDNNLNLEAEEEKLKCYQLTKKLMNVGNSKIQKNIPIEEEIDKLTNLLDKHYNRVVFLQLLNEPRVQGQFEISQITFDILSQLLNKVINKVENDNDYHSAESAIIISQTYYIIEENENKIYLQKK